MFTDTQKDISITLPVEDIPEFLLTHANSLSLTEYSRLVSHLPENTDLPFDLVMHCVLPFGTDHDPARLKVILQKVPIIQSGRVRNVQFMCVLDGVHSHGIALVLLEHILGMSDVDFAIIRDAIDRKPSRITVFNALQDFHPNVLTQFFIRANRCALHITNLSVLLQCGRAGVFQKATEKVVRALIAEKDAHTREVSTLQRTIDSMRQAHTSELTRLNGIVSRLEARTKPQPTVRYRYA